MTVHRLKRRDLENIVALANHLSVTLAAAEVGMSQPAMSTALKQMEQAMGATLFVRHRGLGVSLTPDGELLAAEARSLLARFEEVEATMDAARSPDGGRLVLASLVTVAPILVPRLIRRFQNAYPGAQIEVRTGSQDLLLDWLIAGTIHAAVTYDMGLSPDIEFRRLDDAVPHVVLSADHRLVGRRQLSRRDLVDEAYLLLDLPLSREYFGSLFLADDVSLRPAMRFTDLTLIRAMVGNGFGYSLVNLLPATELAQDGSGLRYIPLDSALPPLGVGLAFRPDDYQSHILQTFLAFTSDEEATD